VYFKYADTQNFVDVERQNQDNLYSLNYGSALYKYINCNGQQSNELLAGSTTPFLTYDDQFTIVTAYPQSTYGGTGGIYYNIPGMALYPKDSEGVRQLTEKSQYFFAFQNGLVQQPQFLTGVNDRRPVYIYVGSEDGVSRLNVGGTGGTAAAQVLSPYSKILGATAGSPSLDLNFKPTSTFMWNNGNVTGQELRTLPPGVQYSQTLYQAYYESYYNNLFSQRFYKAKFKLTAADYADFSFRRPIYVRFPNGDAQEFLVSSISYDPTTNDPADVVLTTFNPIYLN
jgi:hypothetical protein